MIQMAKKWLSKLIKGLVGASAVAYILGMFMAMPGWLNQVVIWLLVIGGLNWGLVAFGYDAVDELEKKIL